MRVRSQRNPDSCGPCQSKQIDVEILPIWEAINFDRLIQCRSPVKDFGPICSQPNSKIVDSSSRMPKYVDSWMTKGSEVAIGLIFFATKCRMERAQHHIQRPLRI